MSGAELIEAWRATFASALTQGTTAGLLVACVVVLGVQHREPTRVGGDPRQTDGCTL
jgi:hypothetical protein